MPGYLYTGVISLPLLLSYWWVFPFIPVGIWAARQLISRISPAAFEWVIIGLLVFSCALLIWQTR